MRSYSSRPREGTRRREDDGVFARPPRSGSDRFAGPGDGPVAASRMSFRRHIRSRCPAAEPEQNPLQEVALTGSGPGIS